MQDRRYPIHGDAGAAWVLVFDQTTGGWFVEEVRCGARRARCSLAAFEQTDAGKRLAAKTLRAIESAAQDA